MNTPIISLKHYFCNKIPDINELFQSDNDINCIKTINAFCHRVTELSKKYSHLFIPEKFKGDALEVLVEYLIKTNHSDNRIGIVNYEPISESLKKDVGVDGYGVGMNSLPATVQSKFRTGDYILTSNKDELSNFLCSSQNDFGVPIDCDRNMLLITTGLKVNPQTIEDMLKNKVRVLARHDLRLMLDNMPEFWLRFWDSMKQSRTTYLPYAIHLKQLRPHQTETVQKCLEEQKGIAILPTGTGKTLCQAEFVRIKILEYIKNGITPIVKVNSSRILLCFQLAEEYIVHLTSHGIFVKSINFNSGNPDEKTLITYMRKMGGVFRDILATTSPEEAKIEIYKAQAQKVPTIIFATYHSSEKFSLNEVVPHITINDECHNMVSNEWINVASLPSESTYNFTASPKHTGSNSGEGMNNVDIYGKILIQKSAKEMIQKGEMVPPLIHIVKADMKYDYDSDQANIDYSALFSSIISAFEAHKRVIQNNSFNADKIGPKVLVVCRGQEDLIEMNKTPAWKEYFKANPDIHAFALSSDFGILHNNDYEPPPVNNMKKYHLIKTLQGLKDSDSCLIFHVDMVGEGIDVPGITGVMPFRNCQMSKFIQNMGRAARLHKEDRIRFYNNEISVGDSRWIKPHSWIIIPSFLAYSEGHRKIFIDIIEQLRSEYGFIPTQHVLIDNVRGIDDEEEIDTVNEITKKKKHGDSGLEHFEHIIEDKSVIEDVLDPIIIEEGKNKLLNDFRKMIGIPEVTLEVTTTIPISEVKSLEVEEEINPEYFF